MTLLSHRDTSFGTCAQTDADNVTSVYEFARAQPNLLPQMIYADLLAPGGHSDSGPLAFAIVRAFLEHLS